MKQKYYIGFFVAVFVFVSMIGIGYQMSYRYAMDKRLTVVQEEEPVPEKEESVTTKGTAEKNEGYYLCELEGDHETIYEMTEIPLDALPETVQEEVKDGKFVETARELYGFLENYSS